MFTMFIMLTNSLVRRQEGLGLWLEVTEGDEEMFGI